MHLTLIVYCVIVVAPILFAGAKLLMATRNFLFDRDYGKEITDSTSKSVYASYLATEVDLKNCGTPEHIKFIQSTNLIRPTVNCGPPQPYLGIAQSGLIFTGSFSTFSGGTIQGPYFPVAPYGMISYLIDSIYNGTILGDPSLYDMSLASASPKPWVLNLGVWEAKSGDMTVNLTMPRVESILDNCGLPLGEKAKATVQVKVDDANCVPQLVAVLSYSIDTRKSAFTLAQATTAVTLLEDDTRISGGQAQGRLPATLNNVPLDVLNAWKADHPVPYPLVIVDNA